MGYIFYFCSTLDIDAKEVVQTCPNCPNELVKIQYSKSLKDSDGPVQVLFNKESSLNEEKKWHALQVSKALRAETC